MAKDYYKILGVDRGATPEEIKKSFRRLAHEHHPDKGGNEQQFKDVNEAYQILSDQTKRQQYDQFGSAAFESDAGGGQGGWAGGFQPGGFEFNGQNMGDLGDLFGNMFGFSGGQARQERGKDVQVDVTMDFVEAAFGADRTIKIYVSDKCATCTGTGAEPNSAQKKCAECHGEGHVKHMQRTILGSIQSTMVCSACHGQGTIPEKPCKTCKGTGAVRQEKTISIHIPAGIDSGETLRVSGVGEYAGIGTVPGDLYVRVQVKSHPHFTRDGQDVASTETIPYSILALGGTIDLQTLDGSGTLNIPEATPAGTIFRIKGKGIPSHRGHGRGDQYVTVQPNVKKKFSKEERAALEQMKKLGM